MSRGIYYIHSNLSVDFCFLSSTIALTDMAHANNGRGQNNTREHRGLSHIDHVPVLDEKTIAQLGAAKVEGFYDRLEKTIQIIHPNGNGTERHQG